MDFCDFWQPGVAEGRSQVSRGDPLLFEEESNIGQVFLIRPGHLGEDEVDGRRTKRAKSLQAKRQRHSATALCGGANLAG